MRVTQTNVMDEDIKEFGTYRIEALSLSSQSKKISGVDPFSRVQM